MKTYPQDVEEVALSQARERLRQEREAFSHRKIADFRWAQLRLAMGYSSIAMMFLILAFCFWVIVGHARFPQAVVMSASAALLGDVLALVVTVWKIVLNPTNAGNLEPVTKLPSSNKG